MTTASGPRGCWTRISPRPVARSAITTRTTTTAPKGTCSESRSPERSGPVTWLHRWNAKKTPVNLPSSSRGHDDDTSTPCAVHSTPAPAPRIKLESRTTGSTTGTRTNVAMKRQ
eukprot:Amastigsp_a510468_6.p4 type:complete len:114 gc:universal Amastigsp_a510468_6:772-431(-)